MEYLGLNSGRTMPMIGYGTWDIRGAAGLRCILKALELGYRLIDTAKMYDNEAIVGQALAVCGVPRPELFITTKLHGCYAGYEKAKSGIEHSLNELQVDYIDLCLIHEPYKASPEMYRALEEYYKAGILRSIGVSNFDSRHYGDFIKTCGVVPALNQVESHVYYPQLDLRDFLLEHGTRMQSWGSLTEGRRDISSDPALCAVARAHGKSPAQIALRYLVQNGVSVIPKSSRADRMKENLDILSFRLTESEMKTISRLNTGRSLFGWYGKGWIA